MQTRSRTAGWASVLLLAAASCALPPAVTPEDPPLADPSAEPLEAAPGLTAEQQRSLRAGGRVEQFVELERAGQRYVGGISYALVRAEPNQVFEVLNQFSTLSQVLPSTRNMRVLDRSGNRVRVELEQGNSVVSTTFTVFFELDPSDPHNKAIADIDLAPRNARGRVQFSADLFILAPQDPSRASGSVLFEISNRGGKGLLTTFNRATASADPMQPEHFGDGLLMRNGITLVSVGWEFDVPGISVKPPIATRNGSPLIETIAALAVVDTRATEVSFSDVPLYPPADPNDETATLTVRDTVWEKPTALPRRGWQFVPPSPNAGGRCAGDAKCP